MSVFILKILAIVTMFVDHLGEGLLGNPMWMRCVGRIAFPCYALLLAEGFRHIKSSDKRVNAHLAKLVILALVSEFCYDLLGCGFNFSEYAASQNNIITLLLAFLGLLAADKWKDKPLTVAMVFGLTAFLNYVCASNFRFAGVLLVYAFYGYLNLVMLPGGTKSETGVLLRKDADNKPVYGYLKRFLLLLGIMVVYIPIYHIARFDFVFDESLITYFMTYLPWYLSHIAVAAILAIYNGSLGYKKPWFNATYSWFYPGHLFILGVIALFFAQ